MALNGGDDVVGPGYVGADRLEGEILAGRHLLHRGGVDDDIDVAQRQGYRVVVAYVADAELQPAAEVVEHDLVGRGAPVLEVEAHLVLLGLVPRHHDDPIRPAPGGLEQAAHQRLAERPGAAGDQDPLAVEALRRSPLHVAAMTGSAVSFASVNTEKSA